jgi:hypothetical protein
MEDLLGCPREHLEFCIWYLKGKGHVLASDNGRFTITPDGVDATETSGLKTPGPAPLMLESPQKN